MPNHITNKLVFIGDQNIINFIKESLYTNEIDEYTNEKYDNFIDFDKIIPETQEVKDSGKSLGVNPLWYDWRIKHWGTKWNSYESKWINDNTIVFLTAWSSPLPVIIKLASMYPEISMILSYYDEDIGNNIGRLVFEKGKLVTNTSFYGFGNEAFEIIFNISPELIGSWVYNEETEEYEWKEEE